MLQLKSQKKYKLNSDFEIPAIGLGTWLAKESDVYNAVRTAIEVGYRHIDCAARYGNEEYIGKAIKDAIKSGDIKREELFVTSKLWNDCHFPSDVQPAIEESLKKLNLDYLDLYMMHWPVAIEKGTNEPISLKDLPISVTYKAMQELLNKGYTKSIGVANFSIKKLEELKSNCEIIPAVNQVEVNLYFQQPKLIEYCKNNGIIVTAAAPLSSQSRLVKPEGEKDPFEDIVVKEISEKYNCTIAQVILAFLMSKGIVIIPKSTNKERIKQNYDSTKIELSADDIKTLTSLDMNKRVFPGQGMMKGDYTYDNLWDEKYELKKEL